MESTINSRMPRSTSSSELDRAVVALKEHADVFATTPPQVKIELLQDVGERISRIAEAWVRIACNAKRISFDAPVASEEWFGGPMVTLRNVRLLISSLQDIVRRGRPQFGRGFRERVDGRVVVRTYPTDAFDATLFRGFTADVRLQPNVSLAEAVERQASFYRQERPQGSLVAVLGAGNVSSIPPMDVLHQMFVSGRVCILKMNPVNEWLGPVLDFIFRPFVDRNWLRIVYGGADVGAYLCRHGLVDQIHVTGSSETFDCIVWGLPGLVRTKRKELGLPLNSRPVTSELGNISPVIIVPGEYANRQLASLARNVVTMVVNNASFNCNAGKLLVLADCWPQRADFMRRLMAGFAATPTRFAYYPGAHDRYDALTAGRFLLTSGACANGHLPWTVVSEVDAQRHDEPLFVTEPFCGLLSQVTLAADGPEDFLGRATAFCNDRLWGTLCATIVIPSQLERDEIFADALDWTVTELRYGTVCLNHWPGLGYGFVSPPWGGHPSATTKDIQSGLGWVHNTYMLEGIEKTVLHGPLVVRPQPPWFVGNRQAATLGRRLVDLESGLAWRKLPGIVLAALRG